MEKKQTFTMNPNKRLALILLGDVFLLIIPLIAMQFTDEVNWTFMDFIAAGMLLLCAGLILELILRKGKTTKFKIVAILMLFLAFFLLWAELAVGIIGTPFAGN